MKTFPLLQTMAFAALLILCIAFAIIAKSLNTLPTAIICIIMIVAGIIEYRYS